MKRGTTTILPDCFRLVESYVVEKRRLLLGPGIIELGVGIETMHKDHHFEYLDTCRVCGSPVGCGIASFK